MSYSLPYALSDLKLEDILISKAGDTKLIDFGLSNVYEPNAHLSTMCGSVFAAPEILDAQPYNGPKVDVWNLGVLLHILVCGRVPFDDRTMQGLRAKIKCGRVRYPTHLSASCKSLLHSMLAPDPMKRATLTEVLNHPWMTHSFDGPPKSYLPYREPLRVGGLDDRIIRYMEGLDIRAEDTGAKLTEVLRSGEYFDALQDWERQPKVYGSPSTSNYTLVAPLHSDNKQAGVNSKALPNRLHHLFSAFLVPLLPRTQSSYKAPCLLPTLHLDPTNGYHPLISLYYLAQEKMKREGLSEQSSHNLSEVESVWMGSVL